MRVPKSLVPWLVLGAAGGISACASSPRSASSSGSSSTGTNQTTRATAAAGSSGSSTSPSTTSSSGGASSSSSSGTSRAAETDAGPSVAAGNPDVGCLTLALPPEAQPVDTSAPTQVVGTGSPASCTYGALANAVSGVSDGGIITFDCGPEPVTIPITATLTLPATNAYANQAPIRIVIDGADRVTLDGGNSVQILSWVHAGSLQKNHDTLTLEHLRLINGKTTPTAAIPACPPSGSISNAQCSTGYDDGEGGALTLRDGSLRIIDCVFENNQAALLGPDTGGGALYLLGTASPAYIVQSTFLNNTASNAGAIGMLWAGAFIFNSLFEGNSAVGTGANNNDATMCTCMNNGQNQTGSGGNGGAIYKDGGDGMNLTICGSQIRGNSANEFGAAVFLTADGSHAQLILDDDVISDNASPISYWQWCASVSTDNPHASGSSTGSPAPINTTFCDTSGACTSTCST